MVRPARGLSSRRFNAFRTHSLKQSLSVPFNGDDVLGFFDSPIGKLRPDCSSKSAVNDDIVIHAFRIIANCEIFAYPRALAMSSRNMTAAAYRRSWTMLSETTDSREAYGID
ncbi:hypothetical protein POJ06DRAFT_266579 [Lipomyces tetrasporus]|uniref:Uncharacterized protein n=1 Tax=Lipomyces tetrasporus TaxID=54092 RepID=A0AAD7QV29_9ASCO|nr:uncharacterized protein POJ06DRAFT_266579 [Lipomyces tetrasporus]KAJ8101969.1 hypothetical protein POJ06DRAFT_266579 [Lipomyces tetrasporus]